ncbi:MAG: phage holin family protein [Lachnospiraceae bacterium]|nr:phage holin family protein [Lachnospiraceae bacterium]
MKSEILGFLMAEAANRFFRMVALAIVFDTVMGVFRAVKERKFNSCVGINGAIRKVAMLVSIVCLSVADKILVINLIGFIPADIWGKAGMAAPAEIGMAEFFSILFIAYEVVSILKNMTLAGLPVKKMWGLVKNFLGKYTEELPDDD